MYKHPILSSQCFAVLLLAIPVGAVCILWFYASKWGDSLFDVIHELWISDSNFFTYTLICLCLSLILWNIRLNMTEFKIYYSVFGIRISPSINRHSISHYIINDSYATLHILLYRQLQRLNTQQGLENFKRRYGKIEFIPMQKYPTQRLKRYFYHFWDQNVFSIHLDLYSKKQRQRVTQMLEQHWC